MSAMPYDTGDDWDEDGYAVAPPVAPGVSPDVSWPAAPPVAVAVSPGDDSDSGPGNDGPLPGVGRWEPAPDDPPPGPGLRERLRAMAGSELLGGGPGGLLAELGDPHPETMRRHWEHVTAHPWRPQGPWGGAAFTAGHLAVTGTAKATGKFLVAVGIALVFAGTRADWAGDRFTRTIVPLLVVVTLAVIILVFA